MKTISVKICVCTQCVMHGSMNIVESVESLKKFKYQLRHNVKVCVETVMMASETEKHDGCAPMVKVGDQLIEGATAELVMERIILLLREQPVRK